MVLFPEPNVRRRRLALAGLGMGLCVAVSTSVLAHDSRAGDVHIEHPYAPPTPEAARTAAVYFRALRNAGTRPDRLLSAVTPLADSVEIHRSSLVDGVMRMRAQDVLDLPPGAALPVRQGGEFHLMLIGLKSPLRLGQTFPLTLRFERGGAVEVSVWVQQPRTARGDEASPAEPAAHQH